MANEMNIALAGVFLNLAHVLGMENEKANKFRIIAYQNAARVLQNMNEDISSLIQGDTMPKISGIGPAIQEKIISYVQTGHMAAYDALLETYPESFLQILNIPHIGPRTAKVLFDDFHIRSLQDLEALVQTTALINHPGFGEKSVQNIREALTRIKKNSNRLPIETVMPVVVRLLDYMKANPACKSITYAGSLRRFEDTIGDVDLLATSEEPQQMIAYFVAFPETQLIQAQGDTKASILVGNNLQIDFRVVEPNSFGAALQYFTGSKDHNIQLRNIAKDKGLKLNEYGVFDGEKNIASKTEEEVYQVLGLNYVPPELRRDEGEIGEAKEKPFPEFVTKQSLQNNIIPRQNCEEIEAMIWDNYPVLINTLHQITKDKKTPLFVISNRLPPLGTWQLIGRENYSFAIDLNKLSTDEHWKLEVIVGMMRRGRVRRELGGMCGE